MCGIVGYIGKQKALPIVLDSLKLLEYRGYDSSGIAFVLANKIEIIKGKGKISNLENKINMEVDSKIAIGHTRWATHGEPNCINAHPHSVGNITLVHNGIIENYLKLKKELIKNGYSFITETDSEVACAYIDFLYNKNRNILETLNEVKKHMEGSYALCIMVNNCYDSLYVIKKNNPLIIGIGIEENFVASDVPAILKYTNKYILLEDNEYASISKDEIKVFNNNNEIAKDIKTFNWTIEQSQKNGYEHFMLKEINEQPHLVENLINKYLIDKKTFLESTPSFAKYNCIHIIGCGSAYHTGLIGKILIEEYGDIPVEVFVASEYRYKKLFTNKKTLVIIISQSGETADSLASLRIAKERGCDTLGIVNVVGSTIARETNNVLYINAGPEIAVATTKAYLLQVLTLSLIAFNIGLKKNTIKSFNEIKKLYKSTPELLNKCIKSYKSISKKIYKSNNVFFLGRQVDYAIAMEGTLKLKEISYIHSECYPAGELKHGTISLIEKNTPIISVITDINIKDKTISNIKEVQARGAYVLAIVSSSIEKDKGYYDDKVVIPEVHPLINPLLAIIPLQLIAYEVAKLRECDIDKPRNLAKSVTVE